MIRDQMVQDLLAQGVNSNISVKCAMWILVKFYVDKELAAELNPSQHYQSNARVASSLSSKFLLGARAF